jgi:hypothetical protein
MKRNAFVIIFFAIGLTACSQIQNKFSAYSCQFEIVVTRLKNSLEMKVTIVNYDSVSKYFAKEYSASGNDSIVLSSFSEYFYKSNIIEFFISTCNEFKFPLYYCKLDSLEFIELPSKKSLHFSKMFDYHHLSKKMFKKNQVNFLIRIIEKDELSKNTNKVGKLAIKDFVMKSKRLLIEIDQEKSKDSE